MTSLKGTTSNGVVRCRRDISKAELIPVLGVLGSTDGGRLVTHEVPTKHLLGDREWLVRVTVFPHITDLSDDTGAGAMHGMAGGCKWATAEGTYEKASGEQREGTIWREGARTASGQRREGGWDACIRRRPRDEEEKSGAEGADLDIFASLMSCYSLVVFQSSVRISRRIMQLQDALKVAEVMLRTTKGISTCCSLRQEHAAARC